MNSSRVKRAKKGKKMVICLKCKIFDGCIRCVEIRKGKFKTNLIGNQVKVT